MRRACRSATKAARRSRSIDVSFTIDRGQSIGIVGPTGAGKSTLVDVLLGLLPPTTGRVLIDGEPLEGRERAWQRQIGYVSQDVYLLDDSLRRNIAFGIPDAAIDEARLARAVTQARLDEVVAALPQGSKRWSAKTASGCRAASASASRLRARSITIRRCCSSTRRPPRSTTRPSARSPRRSPPSQLARHERHGTLIAIAHRLSTVKDCDRLIYLRDGRSPGSAPIRN